MLLYSILDLETIPKDFLKDKHVKIFSFNLDVHTKLQSLNINHELADDFLSLDERLNIFDQMIKFRLWHSQVSNDDCNLEGMNLLKMIDSNEFQSYVMPNLINLVIIKKIIKKEKPTKIIATNQLSKIIKSIIPDNKIETKFFENKLESNLLWNKITVKYNFGGFPLTFHLSRKKFLKIKNFLEMFNSLFYNFWFDFNHSKKKEYHLSRI